MIMLEKDIQQKIIKEAGKHGWYALKIIQTNKNGWPDLQLMKDGKMLFIEVKQPGKHLRPLQEHRKKEIEKMGFKYHVLRDLRETEKILRSISDSEI